jgi:hypothetical protein
MKVNLQSLNWEIIEAEVFGWDDFQTNASKVAEGLEMLSDLLGKEIKLSMTSPSDVQLMSEAFNCAAKYYSEEFYSFKGPSVMLAKELGAEGGWKQDVFYLETEENGQTSYHDPFDQIKVPYEVQNFRGWTEIKRQSYAIEVLFNESLKRLFAEATKVGGAIAGISNGAVERIARRLLAQ